MHRGTVLALFVYFVCTAPVGAQHYAELYGRILDASEAGIPDTPVAVVNQDTGFRRTAVSGSSGEYTVSSLEPGVYKITARKEGFRSVIRFGVTLRAGAPTRVDFALPVGSVEESITVFGFAPITLTEDDASVGSRFDGEEIGRLPLNGRGVLTLLEMAPGTNVIPATRGEAGQFTSSGQRPNTNYFTVDGVSANLGVSAGGLPAQSTGSLPALSAFGSLDSLISLEATQEIRVQTSTSVAEFGRLPGASVALTSRSGSNEFHGATAYRFRHERLAAHDWFGNQAGYGLAPLRLGDLTQTFGGPLARNRAFFLLSFEHVMLRQPYVWKQAVPSLDARQTAADWAKPVLNLFPVPTGEALGAGVAEWVGRNDHPAGLTAGSVRLDQAVTARVTLFGRYNDAPSTNDFGSIQVNRLDLRMQSLTLGLNARPAGSAVLDFRVNESQASAHSLWTQGDSAGTLGCGLEPLTLEFLGYAAPCDYLVRFSIGGIGQLVSGREGDRRQRQFQIVQETAWTPRKHALRLGVDYRYLLSVRRDATGTLGIIANDMSAMQDKRNAWIARSDAVRRTAPVKELSLWLQDTWQPTPRLTVAAGLRWEFSPPPVPDESVWFLNYESGNVEQRVAPLWRESYHDFAPRLGVAWRLDGKGSTVLRAGGGLYFDSSMSIATDFINTGPLGMSDLSSSMAAPFSSMLVFGFLPDLRLPEVVQWNVALEHAFGAHDAVSVSYVGSQGRDLIRREVGGAGNTGTTWVALTTNHGASDYAALQAQYRRHVARGLQGTVSYAWSHSLDNDSSDAFLVWAGAGSSAARDRGSSDFDLRHSFVASLSYELPKRAAGARGAKWLGGWAVDAVLHARSGFPLTVLTADHYKGIGLMNAFRPDLVAGQPVWNTDAAMPGGRSLNPAAFQAAVAGSQGSLGRNALTGFGMTQLDMALRRAFRFGERRSLQLSLEGFNALNHPNFADPVKYLDSALFGQSTSMLNMMLGTGSPGSGLTPALQTGGPRAFQLALRFRF